jgi:hypothetical protein
VLVLCVAVFSWGLEAKLSLYRGPSASNSNTIAKLVQDGQVNKRKIGEFRLVVRRTVPQLAVETAADLSARRVALNRNVGICRQVAAFPLVFPHALFFRPPPFML